MAAVEFWPRPRRAHPDVALFVGSLDRRRRLRVDRLDHGVRRGRQAAVEQVRTGDRLGLRAAVWRCESFRGSPGPSLRYLA